MAYDALAAVAFANRQITSDVLGQAARYLDGECWTLVENAVTGNGGKSSKLLTPGFSKSSSYVWGKSVPIATLQPGDVLQFNNYSWTRTTKTDVVNADKSERHDSKEVFQDRGSPQHSAVVIEVVSTGIVKVIEQNIPEGWGPVQITELVLIAPAQRRSETREQVKDGGVNVTTTTISDSVKNAPKCYRPVDA